MKIIPDNQTIKPDSSDKTQKNKKTDNGSFGKMLDSMIKEPAKTETTVSQKSVLGTSPSLSVKPTTSLYQMKQPAIEQTEKLLNLLDEYRKKLADPQFTLKEIDPIIDKISKENDNLKNVMKSLPEGDSLKEIIQSSLITSSLEIVRFNKGDYIDT